MGELGKGAPIPSEEQRQKWKEIGIPRYFLQSGEYSRDGISAAKYGITKEEFQRIRNSSCGVCGKEAPSEIDHDHICLKCGFYTKSLIRGKILCKNCGIWLHIRGPLCRYDNYHQRFLDSYRRRNLLGKALEWGKRNP
jgi:hypothetical protein